MKLAIVGGGGIRTPLLMSALARRQRAIDLQEVQLMDLDEVKLSLIAPLCEHVARSAGATFRLTWTTQSEDALSGARGVITTIRVGGERARAVDERIALDAGVLGQETTGPAGFAMALRSIPAVSKYAAMMRTLCPDAWLLNFTNPAGLVAQAITQAFPDLKIAGICDSPTSLWRDVAAAYGRQSPDVPVRFYGLNHLSWMAEASVDGVNIVPDLLTDEARLRQIRELSLFEPRLLRLIGMLPNEYLYYYYYRNEALAHIRAGGETRGEQILRLSGNLMADLRKIDPTKHPDRALRLYRDYMIRRHSTYMAVETGGSAETGDADSEMDNHAQADDGEGYAGVALDILAAAAGGGARVVANVPNRGAIPGMRDDDVVETTCDCDAAGLHPLRLESVNEDALLLMQQVKRYERLTVEAISEGSRDLAIEALLAHPLVGSYPIARALVKAYLLAHRDLVGEWAPA